MGLTKSSKPHSLMKKIKKGKKPQRDKAQSNSKFSRSKGNHPRRKIPNVYIARNQGMMNIMLGKID